MVIMSRASNKGRYGQNKAREMLIDDGFEVEMAHPLVKWINGRPIAIHHDFFGKLDIIAVKGDLTRKIQVKTFGHQENDSGRHIQETKDFLERWGIPCELWIFRQQKNGRYELEMVRIG